MRSEMPVPPQVPIVTFYDPNKADKGLIEIWTSASSAYQPIDIGAPHPNSRDYPGFRLGLQAKIDGTTNWVRRVWVTDETSPDWFNYQVKYSAEANAYPTFIRQYREDKKTYVARTKGAPLGTVIKIVLTNPGSGYVPPPSDPSSQGVGPFPDVTASGGGGSGFSGHAVVNLDGTVAEIVIDDEGTGYTSAPTLAVAPPPSGTTATATAYIQPQTAYLIAEQAEEFPKDSEFFGLYFNVTRVYETLPGPVLSGNQTGKWGKETVDKQRVLLPGTIDEGYLVRESKVEPETSVVGEKVTVFFPYGLYGVELYGQDYDPRLDTVIPYINVIRPQAYGIGVNREDITPIDYQHADVRTIDPAIVQAVLSNYLFSYPGRINVDLPDKLTDVYGVIQSSTSAGADQQTGTSSITGSGSISQSLTAQAQASANILPEAYPVVKQFWGNNIACSHYHFFLPNPVTLTDVLNKLNTILSPSTVSNWPKYNPEIVTLVMYGERASVQSKAQSQGSYATSGSGTTSTAGGGVGYSEERGLTIKTLRISPTIHAQLTVQDSTSGTETVTSTAYAEAAGLGPLESQTTGPKTVSASITPTTIPATVGSTDWPTTGLFLYRTDPHPYRYGYIEFHCVVVDAADFPNN